MIGASLLLAAFAVSGARAQGGGAEPLTFGPVTVQGSIGFMSEAYATSLDHRRRDPTLAQMTASATASAYGFSYGVNLLLTARQAQFRQSRSTPLSRLGLSTQYKWMSVAIGDVSPTLSRYSMGGVTARGGYLDLTPGAWTFTVTGGRSRRAVAVSDLDLLADPVYEQYLYGGRIGYGKKGTTYAHLVAVYARDRAGSLAEASDVVRPASNLSLTPLVGLVLFDGRVRFEGELTTSALTRDVRASHVDEGPGFPYWHGLYTPRVGSRVDYAGTLDARVALRQATLQVGYERVAPGFESLGLAQQRSDQEVVRLRPGLRLFGGKAQLGVDLQQRRNNLSGDLDVTVRRRQYGVNGQWRPLPVLAVSAAYVRLVNRSLPAPSLAPAAAVGYDMRQVAETYTLAPVVILQGERLTHTVALTGFYQRLGQGGAAYDRGLAVPASSSNTTATVSYVLAFPSGFSLNTSGSFLTSQTPGADLTTFALQTGTGLTFFEQRMRLNVSAGYSENRSAFAAADPTTARQLTATGAASYRVFARGTVALNVRTLASQSTQIDAFSEGQVTLRYDYRF